MEMIFLHRAAVSKTIFYNKKGNYPELNTFIIIIKCLIESRYALYEARILTFYLFISIKF